MADDKIRPIIKKVKKVQAAGAHGGAWKVAYADFVTAMMAFFMLLWLLNVAPPETLSGLADYFSPTTATTSSKSAGGDKPLDIGMSVAKGGNPDLMAAISNKNPRKVEVSEKGEGEGSEKVTSDPDEVRRQEIEEMEKARSKEDEEFENLREKIEISIQQSSSLFEQADHITMQVTEDGLKIQLMDRDKRPMFYRGKDDMYKFTQDLLSEIGASIQNLENRVTLEGHTDGTSRESKPGYSNWELSADRANAARRVLFSSGVTADRFYQIIGKANTAPLYPKEPARNENRRITIVLMRETAAIPKGFNLR